VGASSDPERLSAYAPEDFSISEMEVVVMDRSQIRENFPGRRPSLVHWPREFVGGQEGTAVTAH